MANNTFFDATVRLTKQTEVYQELSQVPLGKKIVFIGEDLDAFSISYGNNCKWIPWVIQVASRVTVRCFKGHATGVKTVRGIQHLLITSLIDIDQINTLACKENIDPNLLVTTLKLLPLFRQRVELCIKGLRNLSITYRARDDIAPQLQQLLPFANRFIPFKLLETQSHVQSILCTKIDSMNIERSLLSSLDSQSGKETVLELLQSKGISSTQFERDLPRIGSLRINGKKYKTAPEIQSKMVELLGEDTALRVKNLLTQAIIADINFGINRLVSKMKGTDFIGQGGEQHFAITKKKESPISLTVAIPFMMRLLDDIEAPPILATVSRQILLYPSSRIQVFDTYDVHPTLS